MANIVINTFCNLRCPYCFAEDTKETYVNEEMTFENFKTAVEWITRTDDFVGVIGGEPTFHSKFKEFMEYLIDHEGVNRVLLFTNGTNLEPYIDLLKHEKIHILINLNHPDVIGGEDELNRILDNAEKICPIVENKFDNTRKITFGINLYKPNQDYRYFIKALKRFNHYSCRFSVSIENFTDEENYSQLAYFFSMKDTIKRFLNDLTSIDCFTREDCNYIPRCIFNSHELHILNVKLKMTAEKYTGDRMSGGICEHNCIECDAFPVDINTDLTCSRCFGCSEYDKQNMFDYNTLNDVRNYFNKNISNYARLIKIDKECSENCLFFNYCYAGCIKPKLNKIKKISNLLEMEVK